MCRVCPGQSLAEQELFLFFSGIIQTFKIMPAPGLGELPEIGLHDVPTPGPLRMAPKYYVRLESR